MNRRDALRRLLWSGAVTLFPGMIGCTTGRQLASAGPGQQIRVDDSFAWLVLKAAEHATPEMRNKMLAHPALAALNRHQQLSVNKNSSHEDLLDSVLESVRRGHPTSEVLHAWEDRQNELLACTEAAAQYLPENVAFDGTVYLVMGYDIGIASPPDIALNAGHKHFLKDTRELGFCATHEAHHVGFMNINPPPAFERFNEPTQLNKIIKYCTQLEGMAVHAVYNARKEQSALSADADYQIYTDPEEGRRVVKRYSELMSKITESTTVSDEDFGMILTAMSSGERLWYKFGALVAWTLEQSRGREVLIQSIKEQDIYWQVAEAMIQNESET